MENSDIIKLILFLIFFIVETFIIYIYCIKTRHLKKLNGYKQLETELTVHFDTNIDIEYEIVMKEANILLPEPKIEKLYWTI
tara:strand:- start:3043 stop:3288 length:246 start_codon:yes stop_codon:yes gene_type:complete